jgi:hypothetical protein
MPDSNRPADLSTFRLRRRTPGSFLLVPCPKQGRSIRCQGQLEGAAAVILVACPQVLHIQEQPLAIWYAWQGEEGALEIQLLDGPPPSPRRRQKNAGISYIVPDFLVEMTDHRKRLVEVKPSDRLSRPKVRRKLAVAEQFAAQNGWTFHVVTEKELLGGGLLSNLRLLNRYRQACLDREVLDDLEARVPAAGLKLAALLSALDFEGAGNLRVPVFHLLATGRLSFDPRARPLDNQTIIFPGGVISWDPFDSVWALSGCSTGGSGGSSANLPPTASSPRTSSST